MGSVIVLNRFRVPDERRETFRDQAAAAMGVLQTKAGLVSIELVQNVDEPDLWVLTTRWENVGAYRRALSSYDVKLHGIPVLSRAIDEPGAYEVVEPNTVLNEARSRVT